jgi:transposase
MRSWTERDDRIAPACQTLTTSSGRWATHQVGAHARSVAEVAEDLGCEWHTLNTAVVTWGQALLEADRDRVGVVEALGLDEVAFAKLGEHHRQYFATSIVDTRSAQLFDVVPGRGGEESKRWIEARGEEWRANVKWATLDLSGTFRAAFPATLPHATMVADPFHVVRHANSKVDECRRRVQNETLGHRGRKSGPLLRSRRLLTLAEERMSVGGREKLMGLLRAGDPRGEVAAT